MMIEFLEDEIKMLMGLIDVAIKSIGIQGAQAGLHFVKKFQDAQAQKLVKKDNVTETNPSVKEVA